LLSGWLRVGRLKRCDVRWRSCNTKQLLAITARVEITSRCTCKVGSRAKKEALSTSRWVSGAASCGRSVLRDTCEPNNLIIYKILNGARRGRGGRSL